MRQEELAPAVQVPPVQPSLVGQSTYDRLREMILSGVLPLGSALQEKRLADRLGVSRTPVREAITRLASEGLITRGSGATPVVRRISIAEIVEILHVRRVLEVEAAGLAAAHGPCDELVAMQAVFERFRDNSAPTACEHAAADDQLHDLLAKRAGSRLLQDLIHDLRIKTRIFDTRRVPERLHPGITEHLAIIHAVMMRDPARAQDAMRTHIDNVRESILSHLHQLFR